MQKIGMRNIKTAIAVFLCICITKFFKMEYPFYSAIATVIAMQSSVTESFTAGKNRMFGTFLGALVGLIFSLIYPNSEILCGIGIIVIIYLCNILEWKKSVTIGCIVFIAIMTNLNGGNPFLYSANRCIETFLGIAIAVVVNYLIIPPKHIDKIISNFNQVIDNIFIMAGTTICHNEKINSEELHKYILNLEENLKIHMQEVRLNKKEAFQIEKTKDLLNQFHKMYHHISFINSIDGTKQLNEENINNLNQLYNHKIEQSPYERNDINIIYNYHVNEIIHILNKLSRISIEKEELLI